MGPNNNKAQKFNAQRGPIGRISQNPGAPQCQIRGAPRFYIKGTPKWTQGDPLPAGFGVVPATARAGSSRGGPRPPSRPPDPPPVPGHVLVRGAHSLDCVVRILLRCTRFVHTLREHGVCVRSWCVRVRTVHPGSCDWRQLLTSRRRKQTDMLYNCS